MPRPRQPKRLAAAPHDDRRREIAPERRHEFRHDVVSADDEEIHPGGPPEILILGPRAAPLVVRPRRQRALRGGTLDSAYESEWLRHECLRRMPATLLRVRSCGYEEDPAADVGKIPRGCRRHGVRWCPTSLEGSRT